MLVHCQDRVLAARWPGDYGAGDTRVPLLHDHRPEVGSAAFSHCCPPEPPAQGSEPAWPSRLLCPSLPHVELEEGSRTGPRGGKVDSELRQGWQPPRLCRAWHCRRTRVSSVDSASGLPKPAAARSGEPSPWRAIGKRLAPPCASARRTQAFCAIK